MDLPQSVLFLLREEGGQDLVHLASRAAAFRVQFAQRYLTGPSELVWREVASCIFTVGVLRAWTWMLLCF